jgi:hypothetical protein
MNRKVQQDSRSGDRIQKREVIVMKQKNLNGVITRTIREGDKVPAAAEMKDELRKLFIAELIANGATENEATEAWTFVNKRVQIGEPVRVHAPTSSN